MTVRLTAPFNGQAANTIYARGYTPNWAVESQRALRATGSASDDIEGASDYAAYQQYVLGARQVSNGEASALASLGVAQTPLTITAATATVPNDPSQFFLMNSASPQTLTVASGLDKWPIGSVITAIQMGAGALTIAAGSGVTTLNAAVLTSGQYKIMQLIKLAADTYLAKAG